MFFDNLVSNLSAHDVAVACCLAMAEVWVRLPLGAFELGSGRDLGSEFVGEFQIQRAVGLAW